MNEQEVAVKLTEVEARCSSLPLLAFLLAQS